MFHAPFLKKHSIFLVGFRASGKSTIGKALANALTDFFSCSGKNKNYTDILSSYTDKALNSKQYADSIHNEYKNFLHEKWAWIDTDVNIVDFLGQDIDNIVATKGWDYFRQQESVVLQSCTAAYTVFSTGGGMVLLPENREFMSSQGYVVYLKAKSSVILKRLQDNPLESQRPALTGESLEAEVENTLRGREPLYAQVADLVVDAEDEVNVIVNNILKEYLGNCLEYFKE